MNIMQSDFLDYPGYAILHNGERVAVMNFHKDKSEASIVAAASWELGLPRNEVRAILNSDY